jgi:putative hemolysin
LDDICGIIYVKDLLKFVGSKITADDKIADYIRKPLFVPETLPCGKLFAQMTETRIMLAIVVDEYGGTAGIVTMEDVLESIVGNIRDEYDQEEEELVTQIDDKTFTFDGVTDIDEAEKVLGVKLPEGDYDTLAGFVINLLGYLPTGEHGDEVAVYKNLTFTVLEVDERRIEKIKVEKSND